MNQRRFKYFINFAAIYLTQTSYGSEDHFDSRTYIESTTWVSEFLEEGGDISQVTGAKPSTEDKSESGLEIAIVDDLPEAFDLREQTPLGLPPVKNQGTCGSCWAFTVVGVLDSLMNLRFSEGEHYDHSEQTLVSQCFGRGSCSGGWFDAFDFVKAKGLQEESANPYLGYYQYCRQTQGVRQKISQWSYLKNNGGSPTVNQIKSAIFTLGPVAATVYANFASYRGGVFNQCVAGTENHMVVIVGWNDLDNSWIVRNSWGKSWGEDGYIRIKRTDLYGRPCSNIGKTAAVAQLP